MPRRLAFAQLSVQEQPLVYFAVAFILGELVASRSPISNLKFWLSAAIALFATAIILFSIKQLKWQRNALITLILLANCFACGGLLWALNEASIANNRVKMLFERGTIQAEEPVEIWGVIAAAPELAPDRIYLEVTLEKLATLGREHSASGTVRVVVPFREAQDRAEYDALQLSYGTPIRALTNLRKSQGFRNPGATDFDEMLEYRGHDATGLIKSALLIERLGDGARNRMFSVLFAIRANAIAVILRSFTQPTSGIL
ncbi:MAG TPA: DUF4131 domain-containing protein, partial [Blastocatellia bacterium]|nr:DUF4131 domain-containing protein [Blastocatellia bacterium]